MPISLNRRRILKGTGIATAFAATGRPMLALAVALEYGPAPGVAQLDSNENPYGPSPRALDALVSAGKRGAYYIGDSAPRLRAMIAERHDVTPDHVLLSAGSSHALTFLALAALQEGEIVAPDLFFEPTVRMALRQGGGKLVRTEMTGDLAIDLDAIEAAVTQSTSLVHVVNPNNPTGLLLDPVPLEAFCRRLAPRTTVLLDEAYNEITDDPEANSMVHLVREGLDVVVARTFSKIYGMAGLRVGYLIAPPERIEAISPFSLGGYTLGKVGVAAAVACYDDFAFLEYSKRKIVEARDMMTAALDANGLRALPTAANFLFVDLGALNAEAFRRAMAKRNVLIRGIYRDYANFSRVSMGFIHDVEKYVAALPAVLDELGA